MKNIIDDIDGFLPLVEIERLQEEQNKYKDENIKKLLEQRERIINKQLQEIQDFEILQEQENQNILNIQNDIKIKYENNELYLTDKQIKEIEIKKSIIENIETKKIITLKEGFERFKNKKIEIEKVGISSIKLYNTCFKYLTLYFDENKDIRTFKPHEFLELQLLLTKTPRTTFKDKEFKNKSFDEIFEIIEENDEEYELLTNDTINNHTKNYKQMFEFFYKMDYIDNNSCRLDNLSKNKTFKMSFDNEDIKKLFKEIDEQYLKDILKIGLFSGMRISEIVFLKKTDIDENFFSIKKGKTENSEREIYIHDELKEIVKYYLENNEGEFLFSNGNKTSITKRINRNIRGIIEDIRKTFHSTRHSFIEKLNDNQTSKSIYNKKISGHSLSSEDKLHVERYGHFSFKKIREINKDYVSLVEYDIN